MKSMTVYIFIVMSQDESAIYFVVYIKDSMVGTHFHFHALFIIFVSFSSRSTLILKSLTWSQQSLNVEPGLKIGSLSRY